MKSAALQKANKRLAECKKAVAKLKTANGGGAANEAWTVFLVYANRIYEMLREGSRRDPISSVWFQAKEAFRIHDPLLCYLHHARNAEEHSLAEIVDVEVTHILVPPGGEVTVKDVAPGVWQIIEQSEGVTLVPEKLILRPVLDKFKVQYEPPTSHNGSAIADQSAVVMAELALAYFEKLLREADALVGA